MCLMMQSLAVNMVRTMMKNIAHALMTNIRMQGNSKEKIKMMLVSGTLMVVALSDLKSVPLQTWKPQPWHHPCSTLVWNIGETLGAKSCCDPVA